MDGARATRISKLLSFCLRHNPTALGVRVDGSGWARIDDVLRGLATQGEVVTQDELELIVATSDKQRFAVSPDGSNIRANQGHSINVDLGLAAMEPPDVLYHGTVTRFADGIRREGLVRGARTHVHLSTDTVTAMLVARRRGGQRLILSVLARRMYAAGYTFVRSDNGVWLTNNVPPEFLAFPDEGTSPL